MKEKYFLISVDTEGDNQWDWKKGDTVTTENTLFLPRFQALCEKYGFRPTYLTDYKMAEDPRFVEFMKPKWDNGLCEIGMHLHAWSSLPHYELENAAAEIGHCPYLIEYPDNIMDEKIKAVTDLLTEKFEKQIVTHRAGRWAMDERYFKLLKKYNYKFDCSVTPGVNWETSAGATVGSRGSDYSAAPKKPYYTNGILEIPMTIRRLHVMPPKKSGSLRETLGRVHSFVKPKRELWLRPTGRNLNDMIYLANHCLKENEDYIMFMIHSSELMPGGCWRFDTEEKIEKLYSDMEKLFSHISKDFTGATIGEYGERAKEKNA